MYPTVEDILALSELRECRLLTPNVSCKRMVKSIAVMDNPNILKWLMGHEILFSNGYSLANFQNREWKQFFAGLVEKNAAALFIKLSYFVDELPEEILEYVQDLKFPVVVVPNDYSWTKLSDPIQQFIIERQYYYIKEAIQLRDTLNDLLIRGGTLADLCSTASQDLKRVMAVFDNRWNWIGGMPHAVWKDVQYHLRSKRPVYDEDLFGQDQQKYPHYRLDLPDSRVVFIPMPDQMEKRYLAFWIEKNWPPLQAVDTYKIEQVTIVLMLFLYKEIELSRIEKHYYTNFLLDLIDGVLKDKREISEKSARLGRKVHESYQLVVFETGEPLGKSLFDALLAAFKKEDAPIRDIMICERDGHTILFHPVLFRENRELIAQICDLAAKELKLNAVQYAVSRPRGIESLHEAYSEALFALSVHRLINRKIIYYDDLGLLRLFEVNSRKADTAFLSEFYERTICPLLHYDTENNTQLIATLEAYLQHELSVSVTANALYLHENTLRTRIKRIEKITSRSLKIPMDIAELIIGIQIHHLIQR